MKLRKYFKLVIFTLTLSSVEFASADIPVEAEKNPDFSKKYESCMNTPDNQTTAGMLGCMSAEAAIQDARLNKAYKEAMAHLKPARKKQLQEAQRIWLKFKEANCGFYYDPEGGSSAKLDAAICDMDMLARRAKELEHF